MPQEATGEGAIAPPRLLPSYGRSRGRKLRPGKRQLMECLLPELLVDLPVQGMVPPADLFPRKKALWLEIGFGAGEHLAHQASLHPDTGIIGCEPYLNGVAGLLSAIDAQKLDNIRIFNHDARLLIERLPAQCVQRAFILYPDPWPKARHHKRRLLATPTLDALARIMPPGATLHLATDDADYCAWMLEHLLTHPGFRWTAASCNDWLTPPKGWHRTRYEQKALAQGRMPTYLNFERTAA